MLKELGWSFVESLVNEQGAEILRLTKPFIDKVLDKYIDSYTEPMIEQQAEKIQGFFRHPGTDSAAQDLARLDTRSALARMSADETKKAQAAAHQALESAQKAKIEISAGSEDQGVADLNNAEQASTDAQTSANFARDASSSLKDAAEASGSVSHQVQIAASVAEASASDAGASLRAAAQVEEAIKTTKAATQIIEDARAARNAAEAAEAAKAILRAIPNRRQSIPSDIKIWVRMDESSHRPHLRKPSNHELLASSFDDKSPMHSLNALSALALPRRQRSNPEQSCGSIQKQELHSSNARSSCC
jgi:hypothetical protein